jgi:hypothetical protein
MRGQEARVTVLLLLNASPLQLSGGSPWYISFYAAIVSAAEVLHRQQGSVLRIDPFPPGNQLFPPGRTGLRRTRGFFGRREGVIFIITRDLKRDDDCEEIFPGVTKNQNYKTPEKYTVPPYFRICSTGPH